MSVNVGVNRQIEKFPRHLPFNPSSSRPPYQSAPTPYRPSYVLRAASPPTHRPSTLGEEDVEYETVPSVFGI